MLERNSFHDCHYEYCTSSTSSWDWPDVSRTRSAKTLWLVWWSWTSACETWFRKTRLQASLALDHSGYCGRSWWWPLCCIGLFDSPGRRRHLRCHGYGNVQESLEKRLLAEQRWL